MMYYVICFYSNNGSSCDSIGPEVYNRVIELASIQYTIGSD